MNQMLPKEMIDPKLCPDLIGNIATMPCLVLDYCYILLNIFETDNDLAKLGAHVRIRMPHASDQLL